MKKKENQKPIQIEPGIYASPTTSSLKSIANKPIEAYSNNVPKQTAADKKRKSAEAKMTGPNFRPQQFVSPISGKKNPQGGTFGVMIAHGMYDPKTGQMIVPKEPVLLTQEAVANATFTLTTDISKILAKTAEEVDGKVAIQGRLVFSTLEGEFEIDANLVRVKLEDSDVYAQYDQTLEDVLAQQFGKFKGPKPFTRIVSVDVKEMADEPIGLTTDATHQPEPMPYRTVYDDFEFNRQNAQTTEDIPSVETTVVPEVAVVPEKKGLPSDAYFETPSYELLDASDQRVSSDDDWVQEKMGLLETTFENFGVAVTITGDYIQGATVTQFEIAPDPGTKMNRIKGLSEDLKLALSVDDLRIEPIAGKNTIGIEIANANRRLVRLKDILSSIEYTLHESPLYVGLGEDITGESVYADILTMPHGLVAGQTGSGKSVCINTILVSILYKATPDTVRLMLIDPKRVEMAPYNDIPHLVTPVITDEKKAATALGWAVEEMERRYDMFAKNGVRDILTFNKKRYEFATAYENMPYILIIIDELADLMMVAGQEVEDAIQRLTQKARAAGIHLIVATQRPTVNVLTGTIKSNIPSRIAFAVAQSNDSRVIIDQNGAEDLLGRGDMLLSENGSKVRRVQGAFVSDEEVARVVAAVKAQGSPRYLIAEDALDKRVAAGENTDDPLSQVAMEIFIEEQKASVSLLQRKLNMGYNRAAKLVDQLESNGWISPPLGAASKRDVLMSYDEWLLVFHEQ